MSGRGPNGPTPRTDRPNVRTTSPYFTYVLLVFIVPMVYLQQKGKKDPAALHLPKKQRVRPLLLEWLDPGLVLVVIAEPVVVQLSKGIGHIALAVVGAAIGIAIGLTRARVMYVAAVPATKSVIMTRSRTEYLLVVLVIALRFAEFAATGPWTIVLALLLGIAVVDPIARSIATTMKYRAEVTALPAAT